MSWSRWLKWILVLPIMYWVYLIGLKSWSYTSWDLEEGFLIGKQSMIDKTWYVWAFYIHAFSSVFVLILGGIQFSSTILRRWSQLHRKAGIIYVGLVVFVSGPSGLIIAGHASGGLSPSVSFFLQGVLWIFFTVVSWWMIVNRRTEKHGEFMLRSFALALGAVSLRIYAKIFPGWFGAFPLETYLTIAWLSWVGNLLLAECLIYFRFIPTFLSDASRSNPS